MGRDQLTAMLVVNLLAIVRGRIVAGAEHIPRDAVEVADGKRQLGGAARPVVDKDPYAVGGVDFRCGHHQVTAIQMADRIGPVAGVGRCFRESTDIIGQYNAPPAGLIPELFFQILGMALGRGLDGPGVDPVGANAHRAAPAPGAEGDDLVEGIQEKIPVSGFDQVFDLGPIVLKCRLADPACKPFQRSFFVRIWNIETLKTDAG